MSHLAPYEIFLLVGSVLMFISLLLGRASQGLGVPVVLFFIMVGMLAGSEGPGGIQFDNPIIAQAIGVVALNLILFSGGLETQWRHLKPVIGPSLTLSTIGVLISAVSTGIFTAYLLGFPLLEGILLGSIIASTDAAAVFSILRAGKAKLKGGLDTLLEVESGSNDPTAYFLTLGFIALIENPGKSWYSLLPELILGFAGGAALGLGMGWIMQWSLARLRFQFDSFYQLLMLAGIFFTYTFGHLIHVNGFLAVYTMAIFLGSSDFRHKRGAIRFFDGNAWLMQIVLFVTLGMLVFPSQLLPIAGAGLATALFLIFVARPLSVALCLLPFGIPAKEMLFVSWVGLRGAVPIVFATYPLIAGLPQAGTIFNIVFFTSVVSVALQGTTLLKVGRWLLILKTDDVKLSGGLLEEAGLGEGRTAVRELIVQEDHPAIGSRIADLPLTDDVTVLLIGRHGRFLTPDETTVVMASDVILLGSGSNSSLMETLRGLEPERPD
jgi:cell volume regulation protein A